MAADNVGVRYFAVSMLLLGVFYGVQFMCNMAAWTRAWTDRSMPSATVKRFALHPMAVVGQAPTHGALYATPTLTGLRDAFPEANVNITSHWLAPTQVHRLPFLLIADSHAISCEPTDRRSTATVVVFFDRLSRYLWRVLLKAAFEELPSVFRTPSHLPPPQPSSLVPGVHCSQWTALHLQSPVEMQCMRTARSKPGPGQASDEASDWYCTAGHVPLGYEISQARLRCDHELCHMHVRLALRWRALFTIYTLGIVLLTACGHGAAFVWKFMRFHYGHTGAGFPTCVAVYVLYQWISTTWLAAVPCVYPPLPLHAYNSVVWPGFLEVVSNLFSWWDVIFLTAVFTCRWLSIARQCIPGQNEDPDPPADDTPTAITSRASATSPIVNRHLSAKRDPVRVAVKPRKRRRTEK